LSKNPSHYNFKPFEADLIPSRRLRALLLAMHGLCLIAVVVLPFGWGVRMALVLATAASLTIYLRQLPGKVRGLKLSKDGSFSVRLAQDAWVPVEILGSSFVQPWLTVLHLRLDGRKRMLPVVLFPDALPHEAFRRFRVWLHWGWKQGDEQAPT
jgi:toxin CptA